LNHKNRRGRQNENVPVKLGSGIPYLVNLYWVGQEGKIWLKEHTKNLMIPHFAFKFYVMDNGEPEKGEEIPKKQCFLIVNKQRNFAKQENGKKASCIFRTWRVVENILLSIITV